MVVIAIVGVLATMAVVNTGKNPDRDVRLEADRLTALLRDVQNRALAAERPSESEVHGCYTSGVWTCGKLCGFGVHYIPGTPNSFQPFFVATKDIASTGEDALDVDCGSSDVSKKFANDDGSQATPYGTPFFFKSNVDAGAPGDIFFLIPGGNFYSDGISGVDASILLTAESSYHATIDISETGNISLR